MKRYYDPTTSTEYLSSRDAPNLCEKANMPKVAQEWFERPAKEGYEWKCLNGKWPEEVLLVPYTPTIEDVLGARKLRYAQEVDHLTAEAALKGRMGDTEESDLLWEEALKARTRIQEELPLPATE